MKPHTAHDHSAQEFRTPARGGGLLRLWHVRWSRPVRGLVSWSRWTDTHHTRTNSHTSRSISSQYIYYSCSQIIFILYKTVCAPCNSQRIDTRESRETVCMCMHMHMFMCMHMYPLGQGSIRHLYCM